MRLFMKLNATWNVVWPCGPTDKASDYGSGDSRFESWQGRFFSFSARLPCDASSRSDFVNSVPKVYNKKLSFILDL